MKTPDTYKHLIREQEPLLLGRIKRGYEYFITDYIQTFQNVHRKEITLKAREVTYRLLFNMTTTARSVDNEIFLDRQGVASKFNRLLKCKLCERNIQET